MFDQCLDRPQRIALQHSTRARGGRNPSDVKSLGRVTGYWKLEVMLRGRFKNALSGVDNFEVENFIPPLSRCALAPGNLDLIEGDSLFWARISQLR